MKVSKMYWASGQSNSIAALIETVSCNARIEWKVVVPNLSHISSTYAAFETGVFPRFVSQHISNKKLSRDKSSCSAERKLFSHAEL